MKKNNSLICPTGGGDLLEDVCSHLSTTGGEVLYQVDEQKAVAPGASFGPGGIQVGVTVYRQRTERMIIRIPKQRA